MPCACGSTASRPHITFGWAGAAERYVRDGPTGDGLDDQRSMDGMAARVPDTVHHVPNVLNGFVTVPVLGPDDRLNLGNRLYRTHGGERPVMPEEARATRWPRDYRPAQIL
jgi:hypothetical protein